MLERARGLQHGEELLFCNNLIAFKHFFTCSFLAVIFLFFAADNNCPKL